MSGISIFCDTNVVVYLFDGDKGIAKILQGREVKISFITELELLSKEGLTLTEKSRIHAFLNQCTIVDISPSIKKKVVQIRSQIKLKLPDSIIAATAIDQNLPLLTADQRLQKVPWLNTLIVYK